MPAPDASPTAPSLEAIVDLITRILQLPWPTTPIERDIFFAAAGLTPGKPIDETDVREAGGWLVLGAHSDKILWSAFDDELLSIGIFAARSSIPADPAVRQSYDELVLLLGIRLDAPAAEYDNATSHPGLGWRRDVLAIDVFLYDSRDSVIHVDVSHAARAAAHEAYALERNRNNPASLNHPRRVMHLAHRAEWDAAQQSAEYRVSTRGRTLDEVGFIHASNFEQLRAVAELFYADDTEPLVVLVLDDQAIRASGIEIRYEDGGNGQLYPHIYGPIAIGSVTGLYSAYMENGRFVFPD